MAKLSGPCLSLFYAFVQKSFKMGRLSVKRGCVPAACRQMSKFLPHFCKKALHSGALCSFWPKPGLGLAGSRALWRCGFAV